MVTYFNRHVYLKLLLFTVSHILGVTSIEVVTTLPANVNDVLRNANGTHIKNILNQTYGTRRILGGSEATNDRPYMVYLKLPMSNVKFKDYRRWLCGGVIVHEEYILTSAACIEDVKHFYVVSGTYKHSEQFDRYNNMCIKNGAKKAVWKCIPRNYIFDGHENDNIRWMNNDIAVVKVDEEFDFTRRIRGCDYIPRPVCYNNQSARFEQSGTMASIAGWGSLDRYEDWVNSRTSDQNLLETSVMLISKNQCKKRWGRRYHNIIENYMVCTMDTTAEPTQICNEKYVDCTEIEQSDEYGDGRHRRVLNPEHLTLHSAYHNESGRRQSNPGGFCENDHGGPLIYGEGFGSMVIGIISACLVKERTNECYGPFLYTSVYKNRILINCAIYKEATDCSKMFRTSEENRVEVEMSWIGHPDGPAKTEIWDVRRNLEKQALKNFTSLIEEKSTEPAINTVQTTQGGKNYILNRLNDNSNKAQSHSNITHVVHKNISRVPDIPMQHIGLILRTSNVQKLPAEAKNVATDTNKTTT